MAGYCFLALSLEIQNDFDEMLTITNKVAGGSGCSKSNIKFHPSGDQQVTSNGGKTDLTVTVNCSLYH